MKKSLVLLVPVFCLGILSMSATSAQADTLKMTGAATGSTGPYQLSLNGGPTLNLFCIDDFLSNSIGESWNVTVVTGANLGTQGFSSSTIKKYDEEAYIYSMLGTTISENNHGHTTTHVVTNDDVQDALWKIFDNSENLYGENWAQDLVSDAGSASISAAVIDAATFYIPDGTGIKNGGRDAGLPQTFIGSTPVSPVPEPSTLAMFGSGLIGLASAVRRRMVRS